MGDSDLKLRTKNMRLVLLGYFLNYLKKPRSRSWEGNCSARARQSGRNTARRRGGKSTADFISKIEGSLQELEES